MKSRIEFLAPLSGSPLPLHQTPDPVFSEGLLGQGWAINPTEGELYSPCSGKIEFIHPAGHALTLSIAPGIEILMHIGIDSVALKGKGLNVLKKSGDFVKAGDLLITWDMDTLARGSKSCITPILIQTKALWSWENELPFGQWITAGQTFGSAIFESAPLQDEGEINEGKKSEIKNLR